MLTDNQLAEFEECGYLRLPGIFSQEAVANILDSVGKLYESSDNSQDQRSWWDIFHGAAASGGNSHVWERRNFVSLGEVFLNLIDHPLILSAMCQLLSPRISLLSSHLIIRHKSPLSREEMLSQPLGWHRDLGVSSVEMAEPHPRLGVKAAIWLTPLTDSFQGAMQVVPGSHRLQGKPTMNPETRRPHGAIEILAEPGDVLLFEQRLWHAGAANLSSNPRICMFLGYGYRWLRPQDYVSFADEVLSEVTPIRQQLLGKAVTQMGYHLPTPEDLPVQSWFENLKAKL